MAVLNKIRQRSVFLIIIIALALFSFVLADVIRNGGFSSAKSQSVIATVNGEEIDREEFARNVENFQRNMGANASTSQAVNQVWENKLREIILDEELEELGVRAEQSQIKEMMRAQMGNNPNFTNEAGMFDENRLREYVATMKATSPEAYQQWLDFENSLGSSARENIYFSMVAAGVGATLTEGEQAYRFENDNIDMNFVQIPYTSVSDDEVDVSKDEIRDYIEKNPAKFETEASRNIQYVFFEEDASEEDRNEAKESLTALLESRVEYNSASQSNDTLPGFNETDDFEGFVGANSDLPYEDRYFFRNELPADFRDDLFNLEVGESFGPYEHDGYFKISKVVDARQIADSAKASHILVSYQGLQFAPNETRSKEEAEQLADSIADVVRRDNSQFANLAAQFSSDESNKAESGDLGYFGPGDMVPEFDSYIFENNEGDIGVIETDFGYHVIHIEEQSDRERAVKIATLAREIEASERSRNNLFNEATTFEIAAREGDFSEVAKNDNLDIRTVRDVKALEENIPGIGNQRRIVQWAFEDDAKVGDVMRFDTSLGYVVAQVTAKRDAGLMSVENASSEVIPILTKEKKAEIIKEKISGSSLEEIASSQNASVQAANAVNLDNPTLPGAGSEPVVVGTVFGMEPGQVSKPITGDKGVYVVELLNRNEAPAMDSYKNLADQETAQRRAEAAQRAFEALKKKADIEDNRAKFY
ncbi:MAG TPA: peptidylprolyl isomerase [Salegentibacter sp.]|nr:peptidylprolyl isomerase [Salegentibacter sp.]